MPDYKVSFSTSIILLSTHNNVCVWQGSHASIGLYGFSLCVYTCEDATLRCPDSILSTSAKSNSIALPSTLWRIHVMSEFMYRRVFPKTTGQLVSWECGAGNHPQSVINVWLNEYLNGWIKNIWMKWWTSGTLAAKCVTMDRSLPGQYLERVGYFFLHF